MIPENYREKIKKIYQNYSVFHNELNRLQREAQVLQNRQMQLSQELNDARNNEKILINKIEEEINCKLTQEDLIKIINS